MSAEGLFILQTQTSIGSTSVGSAVLIGNTARRPLQARVPYTATTQGNRSWTLGIDVSYDGGNTWNASQFSTLIPNGLTNVSGVAFIPIEISQTDITQLPQVRLTATRNGSAGSAILLYYSDVVPSRN